MRRRNWNDPGDWNDNGFIPGTSSYVTINTGVPITVTVDESDYAAGLTLGAGETLQIVNNPSNTTSPPPATFIVSSLTITGATNVAGTLIVNSNVADPTLTLSGPVAVAAGGEIEAAGSAAVINFLGDTTTNLGMIVSDSDATISFSGVTVQISNPNGPGTVPEIISPIVDNGGTIAATNGGTILFSGATVDNFVTITNPGDPNATPPVPPSSTTYFGTIEADGADATGVASVVQFFNSTVINPGTIVAENNGTVEALFSSILNESSGAITATSGGVIDLEATPLNNEGTVTANGGAVFMDGSQLQNTNLIEAENSGTVTLSNAANSSAFTFANSGTIEAGDNGTVFFIDASLENAIGQNAGTVETLSGGEIVLANAALLDGNVTIASGGTLATLSPTTAIPVSVNAISTATLSNSGTIAVSDDSSLALVSPDTIDNTGTIQLNSAGDATTLYVDQPALSIDGGGNITLTNSAANVIAATASGEQLTNVDNIISGAGTIGSGGMALINDGTIDADYSTPLILDPQSLTNTGTLEATADGTLELKTSVTNQVASQKGTISASGGSTIDLEGITITGGVINGTNASGLILPSDVDVTAISAIDSAAINNGGVTVDAHQTLTLDGDMVTGTTFTDTASGAVLSVDSGDTLTLDDVTVAGGTLDVASGATLDLISSELSGVTLSDSGMINISGNTTIDGMAHVLGGQITVVSGQVLVLDNSALFGTVTNHGTLQVDDGDTSAFAGVAITGGIITDAGTIKVTGTSSITSATIITITSTGTIETTTGALTIDGTPVTNTGEMLATDDSTLVVSGLIVTNDVVQGPTTTNGTVEADGGSTLDLENATISGGIVNVYGVVDATGASAIDNATITNTGSLETGGTFTLDNDIINGGVLTGNAPNASFNVDQGDTTTLNGIAVLAGNGVTAAFNNSGTVDIGTSLTLESADPPFSTAAFKLLIDNNGTEGTGTVSLDNATNSARTAS